VSQSSDGLHLDGVSCVERMIKDTWRVNNLPSLVVVIGVSNVQTLRGESIRLHINVSLSEVVDQTRFTNVGESCQDKCSSIGVDVGQTTKMLSDLFEIAEG